MNSETFKKIADIIDKEKKRGLSPRFFDFFKELFRIQAEASEKIERVNPVINEEGLNSRLEAGLPAFNYDELFIDHSVLADTFSQIAGLFSEYSDLLGESPENLKAPDAAGILTEETLRAWYNEDKLPARADNYALLGTVIQLAMNPILSINSEAVIGAVKQENWRRISCPVCGGRPDFSFLDADKGARWLVCSRCDTEWIFQRLQCPYCGSIKQEKLGYSTDDKEIYRLYTCDDCHKYIKAVNLKNRKSEIPLPLERVLTIDIDRQAQENGYAPGHIADG